MGGGGGEDGANVGRGAPPGGCALPAGGCAAAAARRPAGPRGRAGWWCVLVNRDGRRPARTTALPPPLGVAGWRTAAVVDKQERKNEEILTTSKYLSSS